ncbi:hypothetical protein SME38J_05200 [Serratia marcescens]|nr:hypothetical protein SME38J_05200 [Serratia marcescens]
MILRILPITSLIFLAACSSYVGQQGGGRTVKNKIHTPAAEYANGKNPLTPVNSIVSSNNSCVDNFNFLRQAGNEKYQQYSKDYIKIGDGFRFLNTNKNIMGDDAKTVYTMKLDMKLDTLCYKVNYAGYQVIKAKIKELYGI